MRPLRGTLESVASYRPVLTRFGLLRGREALELTSLLFTARTLRLEGVLNSQFSAHGEGLHRFKLEFDEVRSYRVTDLDDFQGDLSSSLDEVLESAWLQSLGELRCRHYQVITFDFALEVLASGARLRIDSLRD